jgi:TolB-like protein/DNA-binding winged helix-turn-helix (wHTH) protein/cytochrome c-type biogenesis protein CcmH/NrfG
MQTSTPLFYEFGDFRIDAAKRRLLRRDGSPVPLTPRVFDTLLYMVEHSGEVIERDRLLDAVWPDAVVEENNITQNISTLRRLLGEAPDSHRFIVTVPGRGYRFVAEVRAMDEKMGARSGLQTDEASQIDSQRPSGARLMATDKATLREPPQSSSLLPQHPRLLLILTLVVLALGFATLFLWRSRTQNPTDARRGPVTLAIAEKSIAVLPFANLSGDPENTYFADGIKDEILARLSKIAALKVISRTSTEKYKNAPENLREIALQLGVAHILEGSVQKSGDMVRVTVQLINAQTDTHLWAETYDRKLTDMFQVETEVAKRIATALEATLTGSETRALNARPTVSVEAHEAYLKGRYFWNKRTVEGYRQAVEYLNRAVELDPGYAQAYAGLADAYLFLVSDNVKGPELAKGRAALQKALEIDETLAEAHASLGLNAVNFDWDWAKAEQEFRRAIELDPNYATAHQWYGEFLASLGRFDEGIRTIKRAQELDPLSLIINTDVAKVYLIARRYDEAIAQFKKALEMDPGFDVARGLLALTYSLNGQHEKAVDEFRKLKDFAENPMYVAWQGYVYGAAGRQDEAERIANQLRELSRRMYVSPMCFAMLYAGIGEKQETFAWFEKVFEERAPWGAISLKGSPLFDNFRSDPRFADLLRRANFAP